MPFTSLLSPLLEKISEYFDSGEYSDLQIKCKDGTEYRVHKLVLCAQSIVFRRALDARHNFKEAAEGIIHIDEDDPTTVRVLLEYLYRLDYAVPEHSDMLFHIRAYAIGEVYDVHGLKDLALERFQALGQVGWNSPTFVRAVREIYQTTPCNDRGLRDSVVKIASDHVEALLKREDIKETVDEIGAFGKDLLCATIGSPTVWREEAEKVVRQITARYGRYMCPSCKHEVEMVLPIEGQFRCLWCGKRRNDWERFRLDLSRDFYQNSIA